MMTTIKRVMNLPGEYKAFAGVDIKLKDGSVIKEGTDLSQYAELKHDKARGIVEISNKTS